MQDSVPSRKSIKAVGIGRSACPKSDADAISESEKGDINFLFGVLGWSSIWEDYLNRRLNALSVPSFDIYFLHRMLKSQSKN